ncbi:transcription termination factor 4, mitochondrial [Mugil cephalus]|uniref:transcription termination factor 4, mitochondrial n=1 Tax=Mugil cephalus TaxID=48193 RepID=UPI001FB5E434|nr:transcription termination factor 4, mitochondrial [Mugil cephalus]
MCARVAVRQLLRWTVRSPPSSVLSPLQVTRCHIRSRYVEGRLLCSSAIQSPVQSTQHDPGLTPELSLSSLTDMGFTDIQAEQMFEAVSSIRGANASKNVLSTLTALFVLGLKPSSVLNVLQKCPELYTLKETLLQQRISNLRKLGLVEGSLQRVVTSYPKILTVPVKAINKVVMFLREKCLFTVQQAAEILKYTPAVVLEDPDELEYKFQYVYFRMGVKQAEMVKNQLFSFTMDEVRCRHTFLERRGLYETPDKNGQTTIFNPKLKSVLTVDQDAFLKDVAKATAEEYDVFQKLIARECQEEELQQGRIQADDEYGDDDDDDDGDSDYEDDDEETTGKSGYIKRRKK